MRVLLPVHIFLPENRAGVENYTAELARSLAALEEIEEVAVLSTAKRISLPDGTIRRLQVEGIRVFEVVNNHLYQKPEHAWDHPVMATAFATILREFAPDLIHCQHLMYGSLKVWQDAEFASIPKLITLHDFWPLCARMGQLRNHRNELCSEAKEENCVPCMAHTPLGQGEVEQRWIRRLTQIRRFSGLALDRPMRALAALKNQQKHHSEQPIACFDRATATKLYRQRDANFRSIMSIFARVISPSLSLGQMMMDWNLRSEQFRHIRHGLDDQRFDGANLEPWKRSPGPLKLAFIGTIAPHKGVHILIEALKASGLDSQQVSLDIWGPSQSAQAYLEECRELAQGCDNIHFHGPVAPQDVPSLYHQIDVLCVPSLWNECAPLTISESFLAKRACLVSDLGGMAELVVNDCGGLRAKVGDAQGWSEAICRMVTEEGLLEKLVARIPRVQTRSEHCQKIFEQYLELCHS